MLYEHFTSIYISEISIDMNRECARFARSFIVYPGILMFAAVRVFKVSTCMCTIKNKMAAGFLETKIFRNAHTDTRAQQ